MINFNNEKCNFFYSSASMAMGEGYWWHDKLGYKFPDLPIVTKTITIKSKKGNWIVDGKIPLMIFDPILSKSCWNKIGLTNKGLYEELEKMYYGDNYKKFKQLIISIAGTDSEINDMVQYINSFKEKPLGIELNFSCPNVQRENNRLIPKSDIPLYLKLSHRHNPFGFDIVDKIKGVRLNSVSLGEGKGAISGKLAQKYNWNFIDRYLEDLQRNNIDLAGCSWVDEDDLKILYNKGIRTFAIGSVMLINPKLVERLNDE